MIWSFSTLNSNLVTGSEYFTSKLRAECIQYFNFPCLFFSLSQNLRKARKWVYLARSSFVVVALSFHPICCSLSFFRKSFRSRCRCRCCYAFLVLLPTTLCCCCFVFLKAHKKVTIFRRTELALKASPATATKVKR